jgi:hypothetical protein
MKKIKLQATGFEFEVQDNYFYHDDGVVDSIADYEQRTYEKYKINHKYRIEQKLKEMLRENPLLISKLFKNDFFSYATCLNILPHGYSKISDAMKDKQEVHSHICVLGGYPESRLIQAKGHEEIHVILINNCGDLLKKGLESIKIRSEGFEDLSEEIKCDLGGMYSVIRNKDNLNNLTIMLENDTPLIDYLHRNST